MFNLICLEPRRPARNSSPEDKNNKSSAQPEALCDSYIVFPHPVVLSIGNEEKIIWWLFDVFTVNC